jgi:hypothetical protein
MKKSITLMLAAVIVSGILMPVLTSAADGSGNVFTLAEGYISGPREKWQLLPVNEKNVFTAGEKVQFFAQVGPIYEDHQWYLDLYFNDELYRQASSDIFSPDPVMGWNYSNFIPYASDLPPGEYWVQYYIVLEGEKIPMKGLPFKVVPPKDPFISSYAVAARGFEHGEGSEYWNLKPVGPGNVFEPGEKVYFMVQVKNIYLDHGLKGELYRNGVKVMDHNTEWLRVGNGWEYGNFFPFYENIAPGDYVFKAYMELGEGFFEIASIQFAVSGQVQDYVYSHTYTAASYAHGTGDDHWNLKPVNQNKVFKAGDTVYALAQVRDIFTDHRWKVELYQSGNFLWEDVTGISTVNGSWKYGNFYPFYHNAQPGEYAWKIYIDTGSGFKLLDTVYFDVVK